MEYLLLAYVFVCFSVGLVCMGITVVAVHRTHSSVAQAFLAFYVALTLLVLASLILAFNDVVAGSVGGLGTRAALEYFEAMIGFYGVLFTLPFLAHRIFAAQERVRDGLILSIVGLAFIVQHVTEYGLSGRWDEHGDLLENLFCTAILFYTLALGIRRIDAPGVDRPLARRFLLLFSLGIPVLLHDLFLIEITGLRFYPLAYSVFSVVFAWALYRQAGGSESGTAVPAEWNLSQRETEVALLVSRGLSNKEIAAELYISFNTVKSHVRAVYDKSGCRSRFALMSALASQQPNHNQLARNPTM